MYLEKLKKVYKVHLEDELELHKEKFDFLTAYSGLPNDFVSALKEINFNQLNRNELFFEWEHELISSKGKIQFENFDQIYQQIKYPTNYIEDSIMLDNEIICITHNYSWDFGLIYIGCGKWNNGFVYYRANGFLLQVSDSYREFIGQLAIKTRLLEE